MYQRRYLIKSRNYGFVDMYLQKNMKLETPLWSYRYDKKPKENKNLLTIYISGVCNDFVYYIAN